MRNLLLPVGLVAAYFLLRKKDPGSGGGSGSSSATSTPPPSDFSDPRIPAGVGPLLARVRGHIMSLKGGKGYFELDPDIVLAQAILETGWFKSRLAADQLNIFGMMQPKKRPTTSTGAGPTGFATYSSLADSVEDYFIRNRYFRVPDSPDPEVYAQAVKLSGYATDPDYVKKWLAVYRMLK